MWGVCMAGGEGMHGGGSSMTGGRCAWWGCAWWGQGHKWLRACMAGACGGVHGRGMPAGETATEAGGTNPTGMHLCIPEGVTYLYLQH